MYKVLLTILILYSVLSKLYAQSKPIYAERLIKQIFEKYPSDTMRIKALADTAKTHMYSNPDSALRIVFKALSIARKNKFRKYESALENSAGVVFRYIEQHDSAIAHYQRSIEIAQTIHDEVSLSISYVNLANLYGIKENWENALYYYKKAEEIFTKRKNVASLGTVYMNIGNTYFNRKQWDSCEVYYLKAENILKNFDNNPHKELIYGNLGYLYVELKQINKAKTYAEKVFAINNRSDRNTISALHILAQVYFFQNQNMQAENYAINALKLIQKSKDTDREIEVCLLLSDIYKKKNQMQDAVYYLKTALQLKDSLYKYTLKNKQENLIKQMENLNYKIRITEAKQKENQQKKIIFFQRIILFLLLLFLGLTSLLLFVLYRKNILLKQANYQIELKNAVLEQQKQIIEKLNQNLEETLSERTKKLEERNHQLKQYADYNAHILRAPVARVLGLYQIYQEAQSNEEKEQIFTYLNQTLEEIDTIIKDMQDKLKNS